MFSNFIQWISRAIFSIFISIPSSSRIYNLSKELYLLLSKNQPIYYKQNNKLFNTARCKCKVNINYFEFRCFNCFCFYYFNLLFISFYVCVTYYFIFYKEFLYIIFWMSQPWTVSIKFEIFKRKVILNTRLWKYDWIEY